ncbi:glycosyltransferase family 39 protein [Paraflavitalea sp. CAU 1676]|uniref:ArnT family glycosyltransferase n=1 Tax=Paraflavitalea sp. CAU 1676 TaxID=3032598 RepID=UPI0023DAA4C9|nr:glycosyltransferase family 39 protein [Paraflavitalea sp. CAU 1676]MDF2191004.1 glycosyltransferase family 39 protein [Paraflavitalea sp. CAU 1676]
MLSFIKKNHQLVFYIGWCVLNLIQAGFTELFDDEAYYWVYTQFPDWGYFDHPPMVALLIKAGYAIFHNELGVRFFIVLLNTATIFITQQLLAKKDPYLFYAIVCSIAIVQIGGIIAVPDIPLLFFVALYFWIYKRFLEYMNLWWTLLLGISVALMMYSKYHGVLIVLATLASNPKLFTRYQTYLVTLIALLAFTPHLYWQYTHGFPSVQFHLFERVAPSYHTKYTIEYLVGQVAMAGPLMGWLLMKSALDYKPQEALERALKFTLITFYGFFLLSSFRGRVEANWTVPAFIALIVLSHQFLVKQFAWQTWLYKSLPITLGLILLARIYMLPVVPRASWIRKDEFHNNKDWVNEIRDRAQGLPVVFIGTYQKASKYWFYSQRPALSMNNIEYRRNNYNYWPIEDSLIGRRVMVVGNYDGLTQLERFEKSANLASHVYTPYYSFSRVNIKCENKPVLVNKQLSVSGTIVSPANYLSHYQQAPYDTVAILLAFENENDKVLTFPSGLCLRDLKEVVQPFTLQTSAPLPQGKYTFRFAIGSCIANSPSMNSTGTKLTCE